MTSPDPEDESESEFDVELDHELGEDVYDDGDNTPVTDIEEIVADTEVSTASNVLQDTDEAVG